MPGERPRAPATRRWPLLGTGFAYTTDRHDVPPASPSASTTEQTDLKEARRSKMTTTPTPPPRSPRSTRFKARPTSDSGPRSLTLGVLALVAYVPLLVVR